MRAAGIALAARVPRRMLLDDGGDRGRRRRARSSTRATARSVTATRATVNGVAAPHLHAAATRLHVGQIQDPHHAERQAADRRRPAAHHQRSACPTPRCRPGRNSPTARSTSLVAYVKSFSPDFAKPENQVAGMKIPTPPALTAESVEQGKQRYAELGCAGCHGELGRTDGTTAPDPEGRLRATRSVPPISPGRGRFAAARRREDIFRAVTTGLNGTPMPAFGEALVGRAALGPHRLHLLPRWLRGPELRRACSPPRRRPTRSTSPTSTRSSTRRRPRSFRSSARSCSPAAPSTPRRPVSRRAPSTTAPTSRSSSVGTTCAATRPARTARTSPSPPRRTRPTRPPPSRRRARTTGGGWGDEEAAAAPKPARPLPMIRGVTPRPSPATRRGGGDDPWGEDERRRGGRRWQRSRSSPMRSRSSSRWRCRRRSASRISSSATRTTRSTSGSPTSPRRRPRSTSATAATSLEALGPRDLTGHEPLRQGRMAGGLQAPACAARARSPSRSTVSRRSRSRYGTAPAASAATSAVSPPGGRSTSSPARSRRRRPQMAASALGVLVLELAFVAWARRRKRTRRVVR